MTQSGCGLRIRCLSFQSKLYLYFTEFLNDFFIDLFGIDC